MNIVKLNYKSQSSNEKAVLYSFKHLSLFRTKFQKHVCPVQQLLSTI